MKVKELLEQFNVIYPFEDAEKWDNVGLLVGNKDFETGELFSSLELTSDVIDKMPDNSTIVTHHPLIFKPISEIDFNTIQGKLIRQLILKNINYIALHTNYDKNFLNKYFIEKILREEIVRSNDFLDIFYRKVDIKEYISFLKEQMKIEGTVNYVDAGNEIRVIGVCTGSGSSLLNIAKEEGVDLLLTGDIGYHAAIEAKELGISMIDITHYHSEKYFGVDFNSLFTKLESGNPFNEM